VQKPWALLVPSRPSGAPVVAGRLRQILNTCSGIGRRLLAGNPPDAEAEVGDDQRRAGGVVTELPAEVPDVDPQRLGVELPGPAAELPRQLLVGEQAASAPDEQLEEPLVIDDRNAARLSFTALATRASIISCSISACRRRDQLMRDTVPAETAATAANTISGTRSSNLLISSGHRFRMFSSGDGHLVGPGSTGSRQQRGHHAHGSGSARFMTRT
jgi:hypothetical protein